MVHQNKIFNKITVLDNVILFPEHFRQLALYAKALQLDLGLSSEEVQERIRLLETTGVDVECVTECRSVRLSDDELIARLADTDCLITCWQPLSEVVLRALASTLRLVVYWTDITRADVSAAKRLGIRVENVAEYGVTAVPEYVFASLLEVLRRPAHHHQRAKTGSYDYENFKTAHKGVLSPFEVKEETLAGKRLGIVGLGRIGRRVAAIAKYGFGMEVCFFSRSYSENDAYEFRATFLEKMFEECDIVSLHLPPTLQTILIDSSLMKRLRPECILINTGAAAPLDYDALLELVEKRLFRAILDVFPGMPPRRRLQGLENVFFSYRAAWFSRQSLQKKGDLLLSKLRLFAEENAPLRGLLVDL